MVEYHFNERSDGHTVTIENDSLRNECAEDLSYSSNKYIKTYKQPQ